MPYRPNANPPQRFADGETYNAAGLNSALDEARKGRSPYRVYAHRSLTDPAVGTVAVADNDELTRTLLAQETFSGGIAADNPFVTFFEGSLHLVLGNISNIVEARLKTRHHFDGGRTFSTTRVAWDRADANARQTIPMSLWNSVSKVSKGTVTADDGQPLVIDDDLLAAAVGIDVSITLRFYDQRNRNNREQATVLEFTGDDLAVTWWQLRTPEDS